MCVRSIPVLSGVRAGAFGLFPCSMGGIGFVRVRLVDSNEPWVSFVCVRSILVRPGDRSVRSVHSRVPWGSLGCVRSINSRDVGGRFCSGDFGPFPYALGVVRFVRVRLAHSSEPWVL